MDTVDGLQTCLQQCGVVIGQCSDGERYAELDRGLG